MNQQRRIFAIVGASSGNLVEWFDFYIYAFCALYFAPAFLPEGDLTAQLMKTAGVFAAGFLARPLRRDDAFSVDHVRRLSGDCASAGLRAYWKCRARSAARCALMPRTLRWRGIRSQRSVYERGRIGRPARVFCLVSVYDAD